MTKVITIENQELINLIEGLQVEVNARKDLLAYMLQNDMVGAQTDSFDRYQQEYREFFVKLDSAKDELQKTYVLPITGTKNASWNLDFATNELTINY